MKHIFLAQLIFSGTTLVLSVYFGRHLTFEQLSFVSPMLIFLGIFLASANTHSDKYIYYLLSKKKTVPYREIFVFDAQVSLCIFGLIVSLFYTFKVSPQIEFLGLFILTIFYNSALRLRIPSEVKDNLFRSRAPTIIAGLVTALVFGGAVLFQLTTPASYIFLRLLPYPFEMLLMVIFFYPVLQFNRDVKLDRRDLIKFSGPYFLSSIVVLAYSNLDYLVIGYYLTAEDLGVYFFIFQFYAQFLIVRKVALSYIYPKFIANPDSSFDETWVVQWFGLATLVTVFLLMLHTVLLQTVIPAVFGEKWSAYLVIFFINGCLFFEKISFAISEPYHSLRNRTDRIIKTTLLNLVLLIVCIFALQSQLTITVVSLASFVAFYVTNNSVFVLSIGEQKFRILFLALIRFSAYSIGYIYVANL